MGDCVRIGFYANENDGLLNVAVQILDEKEIKRIREGKALITSFN